MRFLDPSTRKRSQVENCQCKLIISEDIRNSVTLLFSLEWLFGFTNVNMHNAYQFIKIQQHSPVLFLWVKTRHYRQTSPFKTSVAAVHFLLTIYVLSSLHFCLCVTVSDSLRTVRSIIVDMCQCDTVFQELCWSTHTALLDINIYQLLDTTYSECRIVLL